VVASKIKGIQGTNFITESGKVKSPLLEAGTGELVGFSVWDWLVS
jgi:hypothetical protein